MVPRGFEQIQRGQRIGLEVVEGDGRRPIVRRLGRGMDDEAGPNRADDIRDRLPIAHVNRVMVKVVERTLKPLLIPTRVPRRSEEHRPLVVVDPVHTTAARREERADRGADET